MKRVIFALGILCFLFSISASSQIIKEKQAILQKPFPAIPPNGSIENDTIGSVYEQFGDLFFEKNGKTYWLPTFTQITGPTLTYYRLFELKLDSGFAREVTNEMLGGYYLCGGLNPPYYYEDFDNDGIKDILIIDHGKEADPNFRNWGAYNIFFKGTNNGFVKTGIKGITDDFAYHHGHAIGDFNNDGRLDIAISGSSIGVNIYQNFGNLNFNKMNVGQAPGNIDAFALKFIKYGNDNNLELIAPPYRDFDNPCCRAQTYLLNLNNNIWNINKFGKAGPYSPAVNGLVWGCAQVLTFKNNNSNSPDLLFRLEGQYDPNGGWYSKYYKNTSLNYDSIVPIESPYFDTTKVFFIDPKIVDINFDGNLDIVHKEYNYGGPRLPLNQRIWLNDSKNNFNPSTIKFDSLLGKQMYLFVKSDTLKKYNLFMTVNEQTTNNNTTKVIFNRFDSLVYPTKINYSLSLCQGDTSKQLIVKVPIKINIIKQPKNGAFSVTDSMINYIPTSSGLDTISFRLKNDFFESIDFYIFYSTTPKSNTPFIAKDTSNSLVSSSQIKNIWYKDGVALTDTTQKIKPTVPGSYTIKTSQNGCVSSLSTPYYYLVTDIINLSANEFIKLAPNPFINQLNFDFIVKGYQRLNLEVFDIATGTKVASQPNLTSGTKITLGQLSAGTYVIKVTSNDNKIAYQFKMVKL